jgi:hypothetical protein
MCYNNQKYLMYIGFVPKISPNYKLEKSTVSKKLIELFGCDISKIIYKFLKRPVAGFRLFKNKYYILNGNILYKNINGHPLECIIRMMAELNFPLNQKILKSKNINWHKILRLYYEIKYNDMPNAISLTNFLTQICNIQSIKKHIMKPTLFSLLFDEFCKFVFDLKHNLIQTESTICKYCNHNEQKNIYKRQIIYIYDHNHRNCDLQQIFKPLINKISRWSKTCEVCKNICDCSNTQKLLDSKYMLISFGIYDETIQIKNTLVLSSDLYLLNDDNNRIYKLKALVTFEMIEPFGKYEIIINKNNEWFLFSKMYIKKITFNEIINMKSKIHYLMYVLSNEKK